MEPITYLKALGLDRHPFPVAPDDENFYVSEHIDQVITELVHGILARKGFIILSGDVGLGKTTITRRILSILEENQVHTSFVFHTSLKDVDLLKEINRDFGLVSDEEATAALHFGDELQLLNNFLTAQYQRGKNCAIIIDDAQNLDRTSLELIRMISNLEADQQKLVQILLVGQPELMATLKSKNLRQLHSRIIIHRSVRPLSRDELRIYILFKLSLAGNQGRLTLGHSAFSKLYRYTKGNFRLLNVLMDRCLYVVCHQNTKQINAHVVHMAYADLYPEKQRQKKHRYTLAASIILPLMIGAASWMTYGNIWDGFADESGISLKRYRIVQVPTPLKTARSSVVRANENPHPIASADKEKAGNSIDSAILNFLSNYHLEQYGDAFTRAMKNKTLNLLSEQIYSESGYQLVQLERVPDKIRDQYGLLSLPLAPEASPIWLLFWQPQLKLKRFYYNYRGNEIYQLQTMLSRINLYRHDLDGIVGTRLMKAVIAFQRHLGLPVTGFPDTATLFLLCHQQEDRSQWPRAQNINPSVSS